MEDRLARDMWGALALKGIAAILFGIVAVFWPGLTLVTLVYLFGGYILATGLVSLVVALGNMGAAGRSLLSRVLLLVLGVGEVGVGVYLLRHPAVSFTTFILVVGIALIVRGVLDLFSGIFEPGSALFKTAMAVGGVFAVAAGVFLLFQPESGGLAFVWALGLYALLVGPMLLALAYEIKNAVVVVATQTARKRA